MRGRNETLDVCPNRPAPVVIEQEGQRVVRQDMLWGFPPFKPGAGYGTNFRTLKNDLWRGWLDREHRCLVPATAFAEPDRNTSKPVVWRWFQRADKQPFFLCRNLAALDGRSRDQEEAQHRRPHAVLDHDDRTERRR
jgi:putative SOS response-associated peptidase YedK